MTPLTAPRALDQFFLDARCRLLDLAAILDRIERGTDPNTVFNDPRLARIKAALEIILSDRGDGPKRAEEVQQLFSLEYDPSWKRPQPRM